MTFNPSEKKADEVVAYLEKADDTERARVLDEEKFGKARKSVLEPYGVIPDGPDVRRSGTGRVLGENEASPQAALGVNIGAQIHETREQIADSDAAPVETSGPGAGGGTTPAGTGIAVGDTGGTTAGTGTGTTGGLGAAGV